MEALQSRLANYGPWANSSPPVFHKVKLHWNSSHAPLHTVQGRCCIIVAELNSCDRDKWPSKAYNTHYLTCYRKSLLASATEMWQFFGTKFIYRLQPIEPKDVGFIAMCYVFHVLCAHVNITLPWWIWSSLLLLSSWQREDTISPKTNK